MTGTKFLIGTIALVFTIIVLTVWGATQWIAHELGYHDPTKTGGREKALMQRLDQFDLRQNAIERDVALSLETLGQFVLYWLTRSDPLPEGERDAAHALGQRRFEYFIEQVARKIGADESLSARAFPKPEQEPFSDL